MIDTEPLISHVRSQVSAIPQKQRQMAVVRQTIVCSVAEMLRDLGLTPLPGFKPPLSTRERIDLVGIDPGGGFVCAFNIDPLVSLEKIKALDKIACEHKFFITFSHRSDKVNESKFFLPPDVTHIDTGSTDIILGDEIVW